MSPQKCRMTSSISLVQFIMEHTATLWNPYLKGAKDKLKMIQNRAIRFIKKDNKSREKGSIEKLREELELETLEDTRLLSLLLKLIVKGLVFALLTENLIKFQKQRGQITTTR